MSTVNPTSGLTGTGALAQANTSAASRTADTQSQFMTLLVTQLQNQDPLNPLDNAQVTSQLAQLETVNGINQLNNTLLALSGQMDMSQSMQAASLIGKDVLVPGNKISLGGEGGAGTAKVATPFGVDVISPAANVVATVLDSSGRAVRQIELGPQPAGVMTVQWDGKDDGGIEMANGKYSVQVAAMDGEGNPLASEALTYGRVSSVSYASTGLQLELGLAGNYSLFDVRKIM